MSKENNKGQIVWETRITPDGKVYSFNPQLRDIIIRNKDKIIAAMNAAREERGEKPLLPKEDTTDKEP